LQEGDVLHIFVADKEIATVAATLAGSPKER